jgi:hypothetical protein
MSFSLISLPLFALTVGERLRVLFVPIFAGHQCLFLSLCVQSIKWCVVSFWRILTISCSISYIGGGRTCHCYNFHIPAAAYYYAFRSCDLPHPVPDRTANTLMVVISDWIESGTTVISECWAAYLDLDTNRYVHQTVNYRSVLFMCVQGLI